ncbi:MAG: hypothetical protein EXR98_13485 [Gemmataceae bacterium]|nr:hypothetical protein [Gemmataceae bacterium]
MYRSLAAVFVLGLLHVPLRADEVQEKEPIPAPKKQIEPTYPIQPRQDTIDVWQHYAVGTRGRFVPRVIVTPFGAFYSRDLSPFPWVHNRTTALMPNAVD